MAGRGRGRGRGALKYEEIRPGESPTDKIIGTCLSDWHKAPLMAEQGAREVQDDKNFRPQLMTKINRLYEERETMREREPEKYLGAMALLCQIFAKVRDTKHRLPFKILLQPVLEVVTTMLDEDASKEEIRCATSQLRDVLEAVEDSELDDQHITSLRNLRMNVRSVIINSREPSCVGSLLDATETICLILTKVS